MKRMTKLLSLVLAALMLVGMLPLGVWAAGETPSHEPVRYTVLLLDTEREFTMTYKGEDIYTVKTPLEVIKEAAKRFVSQIQSASGTNYVAVVSYSASAKVNANFTTDMNSLNSAISGLTIGDQWANINAALLKADELLSGVTNPNATKNIVLFTQGIDSEGEYSSEGQYTQSDCDWRRIDNNIYHYQYSNVAYKTAHSLMDKYNMYSIGLFQQFGNVPQEGMALLHFAKRFSADLQNKGFYDVDDVDKLVFTFGNVAEDIADVNADCPIIVIPGIMGSRLYHIDNRITPPYEAQVWDPVNANGDLNLLNLGYIDYKNNLFVKHNNINQVNATNREYGPTDIYRNLVDALCGYFPNREVYFFSYDFRASNIESAKELKGIINTILHGKKWDKVDLICHSMGGLVASSYVAQNGPETIHKVVTMGTPYEGATKLLWATLTKDVLDDPIKDIALNLSGLTTSVKARFPSMPQLAPTEELFSQTQDNYQRQIWRKDNMTDTWKPKIEKIGFSEYRRILSRIFGSELFSGAEQFHSSIKTSRSKNILVSLDNSFFIIGMNYYTIGAVTVDVGRNGIMGPISAISASYQENGRRGDGTVPYFSGAAGGAILELPKDRYLTISETHTGLVSNRRVIEWVLDVLSNTETKISSDMPVSSKYVVVRIACPVDVSVTRNGETLSSDSSTLNTETSFGCLDFIGENGDIKMLCLDDDQINDLILSATDDGTMELTLRWFNENDELLEERTFEEVLLTKDAKMETNTDRSKDSILEIDTDGDGSVDRTQEAVVTVQNEKPSDPDDDRDERGINPFGDGTMPRLFQVTMRVGAGGSVNVPDSFSIAFGATRTIKITPNEGYAVADVVVNGKSIGAVTEYKLTPAVGDSTVEVTFAPIGG